MKRLLTLTLAVCLAAGAAVYAQTRGSWTAELEENGKLHLNMSQRRGWMNGHTFNLAELAGLTAAQLQAGAQTPVQFQLRRDAGTVTFDGVFKGGTGAGQFTFAPNAGYITELRNLGLELEPDRRGRHSEEDQLFTLAVVDLSPAYIRAMRAEGFHESLDEYIGMRAVGVTTAYVRDLRAMGLQSLSGDDVTGLRAVGVTREYVDAMRALFPNTSLDDLQGMKAVGVTPAWVQSMRTAGVTIASGDTATGLKAVGVTPEYIRGMREVFPKLDGDDVQGMKAVGVTPEYVRELRAAGVKFDDHDDVTSMKAVGVTVKFVQQLAAAGYKNLSADKLTELKAVGVDEKFIRSMSKYEN